MNAPFREVFLDMIKLELHRNSIKLRLLHYRYDCQSLSFWAKTLLNDRAFEKETHKHPRFSAKTVHIEAQFIY